jgi:uncharacterized protein YbjT (DUF2867 family)
MDARVQTSESLNYFTMKTYVIIGATGNTGKPAALGLLEKGHTVRIVSRDAQKAQDLIHKGAHHFPISVTDVTGLKKTMAGANAAYVVIPNDLQAANVTAHQIAVADSVAKAIEGSGITHVVTLSSVGAHLKQGAGVVQGLQRMEEILNALQEVNVLHLRAAYFMENTLSMAGMAKHMGIIGSPVKTSLHFPVVATRDIAATALRHLLALDFTGKSHEYVLGPRDYSYPELAAIFGKAIGKSDLPYVQFPYDDARKAMIQMGLGENYVDQLLELTKAMNEGKATEDITRTSANTTPTRAEDFAPVFAAAYAKA